MAKKQENHSREETKQAQRIGLFGASGSGKTTEARKIASKLKRIVYFDTVHEFCRTEKGVKIFHTLQELKKAMTKDYSKGFRYVYVPTYGNWEQELDFLCTYLVSIQGLYHSGVHTAQLTLVVDELSRPFPSGIRQRNPKHAFGFLCCMGRHYGINLVGIAQRTAQVDAEFRSNLSMVYFFRQSEAIDMDTAKKMLGSKWSETLRNMPNFQCIIKTPDKIFHRK